MIPENMNDIDLKMEELNNEGKSIDKDTLIKETVLQLFQAYLDNAEDGHYDTGYLLDNNQIEVKNIANKSVAFIKDNEGFIESFKKDSFTLLLWLEKEAHRVANL
ncbi:hypothetical protein GSH19_00745 [Lactobacillus sp. S2-2]|uniref:hypothetical protein n=1 Tax=Lactobacillus sp. S2-2 TaxID=2692917 RepID=UPI001F3C02C6|nr:hypothetical protein [Lactobacillus sp. S2-2]MCF6514715.1 hypothetical protein [Lactobacillus sp. S2-2]